MPTAQTGDRVEVHFTGYNADGSPFAIDGGTATLDANHPLAGETLIYELELSPR